MLLQALSAVINRALRNQQIRRRLRPFCPHLEGHTVYATHIGMSCSRFISHSSPLTQILLSPLHIILNLGARNLDIILAIVARNLGIILTLGARYLDIMLRARNLSFILTLGARNIDIILILRARYHTYILLTLGDRNLDIILPPGARNLDQCVTNTILRPKYKYKCF